MAIDDFYTAVPDPDKLVKDRFRRLPSPSGAINIYQLWWRAFKFAIPDPDWQWQVFTREELGYAARDTGTFEEWFKCVGEKFNYAPWFLVEKITTVEQATKCLSQLAKEEVVLRINTEMPRPQVLAEIKRVLNEERRHSATAGNPMNREMLSEFPIRKILDGPAIKRLLDIYEASLACPNDKVLAKVLHEEFGYPVLSKSDLSKGRKKAIRLIKNATLGIFPDYLNEYQLGADDVVREVKPDPGVRKRPKKGEVPRF